MVDPVAKIAQTSADAEMLHQLLKGRQKGWGWLGLEPDLNIMPQGKPYLYRWYLRPKQEGQGNIYLHYQVGDDQERAQHDHPWDNTSIIVSGGYTEYMGDRIFYRRAGEVVHRPAEQQHRLEMGPRATISLFITGPKRREWGFHTLNLGWVPYTAVVEMDPVTRTSIMKGEL